MRVVHIQPALVIGVDVTPLVFEFVSERPEELTLDDVVEGTESATTDLSYFGVTKVS